MNKITIVGAGALGSHLVQLVRNVDAAIRVVDFDRVEQRNTGSQFHGKPHVGKLKTESVKATMQLLWGVRIETLSSMLGMSNQDALLGNSDLVVDCLDNIEGRKTIMDYTSPRNVPVLHGALAADGTFGRVVWSPLFKPDGEPAAGALTCEDGNHLPFIAIVAAFMAKAVTEWSKTGKKIGYALTPTSVTVL